jgi:cytoskeletal protein CcmA (bactofilin family)
VESKILNITSNEGSILKLNVDAILNVKTNSGGMIDVSGNAETQEVLVNSGANFNGRNLKSEITSVTTNAGGNADVYASKTINCYQ